MNSKDKDKSSSWIASNARILKKDVSSLHMVVVDLHRRVKDLEQERCGPLPQTALHHPASSSREATQSGPLPQPDRHHQLLQTLSGPMPQQTIHQHDTYDDYDEEDDEDNRNDNNDDKSFVDSASLPPPSPPPPPPPSLPPPPPPPLLFRIADDEDDLNQDDDHDDNPNLNLNLNLNREPPCIRNLIAHFYDDDNRDVDEDGDKDDEDNNNLFDHDDNDVFEDDERIDNNNNNNDDEHHNEHDDRDDDDVDLVIQSSESQKALVQLHPGRDPGYDVQEENQTSLRPVAQQPLSTNPAAVSVPVDSSISSVIQRNESQKAPIQLQPGRDLENQEEDQTSLKSVARLLLAANSAAASYSVDCSIPLEIHEEDQPSLRSVAKIHMPANPEAVFNPVDSSISSVVCHGAHQEEDQTSFESFARLQLAAESAAASFRGSSKGLDRTNTALCRSRKARFGSRYHQNVKNIAMRIKISLCLFIDLIRRDNVEPHRILPLFRKTLEQIRGTSIEQGLADKILQPILLSIWHKRATITWPEVYDEIKQSEFFS